MAKLLCSVERELWFVGENSTLMSNAGCLLGHVGGLSPCSQKLSIPTKPLSEIPSPLAPPKGSEYDRLAAIAEKALPKTDETWWRANFALEALDLSKNASSLPRKLLSNSPLSVSIATLHQCVFEPGTFTWMSLDFSAKSFLENKECFTSPRVKAFYEQWTGERPSMFRSSTSSLAAGVHANVEEEELRNEESLLRLANGALSYFLEAYGNTTDMKKPGSCVGFVQSNPCRGALAAAAMVVSTQTLVSYFADGKSMDEDTFASGFLLASIARALLHNDLTNSGNKPSTIWKIKLVDVIALQSAWQKLYADSFGSLYTLQLNEYVPNAFAPPSLVDVFSKPQWRHLTPSLEPIYSSLRNFAFSETGAYMDLTSYRPLVAHEEVIYYAKSRRRVLCDFGAGNFFGSAKVLLGMMTIRGEETTLLFAL